MTRDRIEFLRNGRPVSVGVLRPSETLLDYLRLREGAMGTKEGCNEGDCGACTVMIGRVKDGSLVYEPVNACIALLGQIDGRDLVTVDDLAEGDRLHPVQRAMVESHGSQCGFCTPGIVMSLAALYHAGVAADRAAVNDWLAGNLCRCTGYRPIADAALAAIDGKPDDHIAARRETTLARLRKSDRGDVMIGDDARFLAAPASLDSLCRLCAAHPDATIVSGATDVGLWITKQLLDLPKIVLTGRVGELCAIDNDGRVLTIGAAASYADAQASLGAVDPDIGEVVRRLGSRQVRASGTVGGNIANGSPIGDMPPMLIALGAEIELRLGGQSRTLALEDFFIDYGKQDRRPGEVLIRVRVPKLARGQHFRAYKVSKRFDQDISAVLAAMRFTVEDGRIAAARIAFGGMAATPKRAAETEAALTGVDCADEAAVGMALARMDADFTPISDMRASAGYRQAVAKNLIAKALAEIASGGDEATRVTGRREAQGMHG